MNLGCLEVWIDLLLDAHQLPGRREIIDALSQRAVTHGVKASLDRNRWSVCRRRAGHTWPEHRTSYQRRTARGVPSTWSDRWPAPVQARKEIRARSFGYLAAAGRSSPVDEAPGGATCSAGPP